MVENTERNHRIKFVIFKREACGIHAPKCNAGATPVLIYESPCVRKHVLIVVGSNQLGGFQGTQYVDRADTGSASEFENPCELALGEAIEEFGGLHVLHHQLATQRTHNNLLE